MARTAAWAAGLMILGCSARTSLDANYLSASQSAKFMGLHGTSLVLGRAWYPRDLASDSIETPRQVPLASGTLDFVDHALQPIPHTPTGTLDASGTFQIASVPADQPMLLRVRFQVGGRAYQELKFVSTDQPLVCARVDYATSLIAAKMVSKMPLFYGDASLDNLDPLPFFEQGKLAVPENMLDQLLAKGSVPVALAPQVLSASGLPDAGVNALAALVEADPSLGAAYNGAADPVSTFQLGIASLGVNRAAIPGLQRRDRTVFGVLNLQVALPAMPLDRIEYLLDGTPIASASDPTTNWQSQFDTWTVPNGPHFLDSVGVVGSSRRNLTASYVNIENTTDYLCPEGSVDLP